MRGFMNFNLESLLQYNLQQPASQKLHLTGLSEDEHTFDADVPYHLVEALQSLYRASADARYELEMFDIACPDTPAESAVNLIGHSVSKICGSDFKGGSFTVKVKGLIVSPQSPNELAFVYHYSGDDGRLCQSYVNTSSVELYRGKHD
jgi:hypothetical protein